MSRMAESMTLAMLGLAVSVTVSPGAGESTRLPFLSLVGVALMLNLSVAPPGPGSLMLTGMEVS